MREHTTTADLAVSGVTIAGQDFAIKGQGAFAVRQLPDPSTTSDSHVYRISRIEIQFQLTLDPDQPNLDALYRAVQQDPLGAVVFTSLTGLRGLDGASVDLKLSRCQATLFSEARRIVWNGAGAPGDLAPRWLMIKTGRPYRG